VLSAIMSGENTLAAILASASALLALIGLFK
jgi:hypothetical protein